MIIIDLTAIFDSGNEPSNTADLLDKLSYFDRTSSIYIDKLICLF